MAHPPNKTVIDIAANRNALKWSRRELIGRALWDYLGVPVFRVIPRPFWQLRSSWLRMFGAKVGRNVHIHPSARIQVPWNLSLGDYSAIGERAILYPLGPITIGARATVSQYAHLCAGTHDYTAPQFTLLKLPIVVGDGAWVCAGAFIGPGVDIGEFAIVGAAAVVTRSIPARAIVAGNPVRVVGERRIG